MEYKLFDDYITLQALFKMLGIIQSGGAIKDFLASNTVLLNGEDEKRRGRKIRLGDRIELPQQGISITIIAPSPQEVEIRKQEETEKERVTKLVKEMNQGMKQKSQPERTRTGKKTPVRFPGT